MNNAFFIGQPVNFKNICYVYPPTVKEVSANEIFNSAVSLLTLSQEEIEDLYVENNIDLSELLNPFEYILNNGYNSDDFEKILIKSFYFFIKEEVHFIYEQKKIVIGDLTTPNLRILTEEDYFDFQNLLRESLGDKRIEPPNPNENPKIKKMKAKARYRDKIKAKRGMGLNLNTTLTSICCMNMGINPLNIGELSYASLSTLVRRYQEKEKYQLDIDSLLAGADSKKVKPNYWIRNLDD